MMDSSPPVLVINLDGSTQRLAQVEAQFASLGRTFQRVPAVDGRRFRASDVPSYDESAMLAYMGRTMMGGELGCYLSHMRAAEAFLATGEEAGFVFEDDVIVPDAFFPVAEAALAWLRSTGRTDWRLINFGDQPRMIWTPLRTFEHGGKAFELCAAHYFSMTAHALLWSRKGATEFLEISKTIRAPVDNVFRHWLARSGGGLGVRPSLCAVRAEGSDIAGQVKRSQHGRTALYGLKKQRRLWADKFHAFAAKRREAKGRSATPDNSADGAAPRDT